MVYAAESYISGVSEQENCSWSGTWDTNWGEMQLIQNGDIITGSYDTDGQIQATVSGNMLIGTWSEPPSYQPPDDSGGFEFFMSEDCMSFVGHWKYGSDGGWAGSWEGISAKA